MAENKSKKVSHKPLGKKELQSILNSRLYQDLEAQSVVHYGIQTIAIKLANYIGVYLPHGQTTLLEIILLQAIADWHSQVDKKGIQAGYSAYCLSIFKALPRVLNYTVTAKTLSKPNHNHTWDCTSLSIIDWIIQYNIDVNTLEVVQHTAAQFTDPRDAAFLLCPRVFSRQELQLLGVVNEIHGLRQGAAL